MKCGIVGLPNVGKSTLFNCLSNAKAQSANYPFCTIEPNLGTVQVPDPRLYQLENLVKPEKVIPAVVEIVDIAGLVKGASKGEGGRRTKRNDTNTVQDNNTLHIALESAATAEQNQKADKNKANNNKTRRHHNQSKQTTSREQTKQQKTNTEANKQTTTEQTQRTVF